MVNVPVDYEQPAELAFVDEDFGGNCERVEEAKAHHLVALRVQAYGGRRNVIDRARGLSVSLVGLEKRASDGSLCGAYCGLEPLLTWRAYDRERVQQPASGDAQHRLDDRADGEPERPGGQLLVPEGVDVDALTSALELRQAGNRQLAQVELANFDPLEQTQAEVARVSGAALGCVVWSGLEWVGVRKLVSDFVFPAVI